MSFQYKNKAIYNHIRNHIRPTGRGICDKTVAIPIIPLIEQLINEKP